MSNPAPHIAVDRIVPVYLGRDMELILARVQPNPPARFLALDDEASADTSDPSTPSMEIVGRIRLGPEEASDVAQGILSILASVKEIDRDSFEEFAESMKAKIDRIFSAKES